MSVRGIFQKGSILWICGLWALVLFYVGNAQAVDKVILASGLSAPFSQFVVSVDKGFMKNNGVNAEYKIFSSSPEGVIAVGAGEAHIGSTESLAIKLRAGGAKLLIVGRANINPKDVGFAASKDIQKPEDLKGKKVGVLLGTAGDIYSDFFFAYYGLKEGPPPNGVTKVNIAAPEWVAALNRGDIAGFFGWEPFLTKAGEIVKGARVMHRSGIDPNIYTLNNALLFNEDWVKKDPNQALRALKAMLEAEDWIMKNVDETAKLCSGPFRTPTDQMRDFLNCCSFRVDFSQEFVDHTLRVGKWLEGRGELKDQKPDAVVKGMLYPSLLKSIAPDRVSYKE